ncbi:carbohydrate binding domain-containing protein [Lactiplantibacillus plantarum]|uniref:carbohydrate binding domain-containing protein n=1 Tax=Lactiplantibacillus plantarum TaxID=1590 RepID=UPI002739346E|nr:carbohydrate binding domain-containing protein [Lactiplantibacillus plantarum]MDP4436610.1 carbohydrate binding domain-containing protein [Lactiplantibacillus plantarum]MDP4439736.1 carbohydrate binding domain-containing protein [Lactiplantibacillus plantarum]MDP4458321.1 carbohydrate binding domain-containing protein [Lactiplantibacillus plantarum]
MAESNATQVILTDDGIKIIKAQNTADNAAGGITNLNDPNLMSVIEKQNNIGQFAGLTSQYNVLVQNAKDDGIDTTAVTTAYNNLNQFMADILADPDHASDIDRATYKKYQDAYNEELVNIQNALQNNANNKFASAANAASQAAIATSQAFSQAQSVYDYANSEIAVTSTAINKAQSAADSASSQAIKAIDTGNVTSQAVTDLKDGSTMTIAQLQNGLESKVANSEYASYKYQTSSQIGEMVTNGAFSAYQITTADLISSKVATSDFSAYQAKTAKAIESKVESKDFNSYKLQTADAITSKVSKKDANNVNLIPYSSNFSDSLEGWQLQQWGATDRALSAVTHNFYKNGTGKVLLLNTSQNATAAAGSLRFSVLPNTKYTFQFKAFASSNVVGANVYFLSRAYGSTKDYDTAYGLFNNLVTSPAHIDQYTVTFTTGANDNEGYIRVDNIGSNNGTSSGLYFTELKMEYGDTATPYIYGGQDSMISQMSDDILFRVAKDDLISQINIQARNTLISSGGQLTLSGKNIYFDTDNPVIIPSANIGSLLVNKQLKAADIEANTFSTNNGTFTVKQDGSVTAKNMTLNGGKLYSPTINAGTINGSTINGTTFHGGDIINNANNTAKYYPMTITPDGAYKSTYFDSAVGLQSSVESGAINYKYRSMIGNGQYLAYDSVINGQGFESHSGYTSTKDATFSNTETITGYVNVTPDSGIYLYGPTQKINFAGNADNIGSNGITMDAYGNIYAQANSAFWRIRDINGNEIANFGIDTANKRDILFSRDTQVGNLFLGVGHTIGMLDRNPLYFKQGDSSGKMLEIHAGGIYYESLTKSSLLSVKKDVKKVDTAYWSQLVNSIDLATYQYKTDDNTSHIRLSSIVDDVNDTKQWQLPDIFISRDEDGKLCGVDDSVLLNATLATVQEQQKEIDQLNGHLLELEAKLNG